MSSFHFLRPGWLAALPVLLAVLIWLWRRRLRSRSWQAVCDPELLPHLLLGRSRRRANWPLWLVAAGTLLAVVALAGPVWEKQPQPLFRRQSALVVLFDLSRSMAAADLHPSRLEQARMKIEDLLARRQEGQNALVAFAGDAFVVTPLTDDVETVKALLKSLTPDLMPVPGSDPARAMELGMELLQQAGLKQGRLLLVTDEDRPGRALEAARKVREDGFSLAVIGVGSPAGAPVPLAGGGFLKGGQGNLVLPRLDEAGLRQVAAAGGGAYRRLTLDDSDLQGVLAGMERHRLDEAERINGKTGARWREEGVWLLWPLALVAALGFRRGWLGLAVLLLLPPLPARAMTWQDLWQRPEQQAAGAFGTGRYGQAGQLFRNPAWKAAALYRAGRYQEAAAALEHPDTADDWYNKGNALARSGQLPQALAAYQQALKLDPAHADAAANKKLVEQALARQQQPQSQPSDRAGSGDPDSASRQPEPGRPDAQQKAGGTQQPEGSPSGKGSRSQLSPAPPAEEAQQKSPPSSPAAQPQPNPADRSVNRQGPDSSSAPAGNSAPEKGPEAPQGRAGAAPDDSLTSEQERALRQWLQRIPDDPGGLLRRKFLYQYRQRDRQVETDRPW